MNVSLDFDNDGQQEQYESSSYLPFAALLDSIALKPSEKFDDEIDIVTWGLLPENQRGYENYYSFHAFRNDLAINDSLVGFSMVTDEMIGPSVIAGVTSLTLAQDSDEYFGYYGRAILHPGDIVTLRLDVFTKEYGEFITHAQAEANGSIPIFSGPPANVETNILKVSKTNEIPVAGFFSAFSGRSASTIYQP